MESLTDEEVLSLSKSQMDEAQNKRLSVLLEKQQAGIIHADEKVELETLMQIYQDGSLRKAQALAEAVRRGLRKPLDS